MSNLDLTYVKFILSSEPTSTIMRNLSTNEISLIWEEKGIKKSYYLETVTKQHQNENEKYWKKFMMECQAKTQHPISRNEEMPEEAQLFIQRTLDKRKK